MTLLNKLQNFYPTTEIELTNKIFPDLAESFLYGGYISVSDYRGKERYRIYLRTVEFYCHPESDNLNLPKDPIVYHRNGRYLDGDVPYFPLMAFHAHASGYDIAFENEDLKLRSSVLIRAYEIYDLQNKKFLFYSREYKKFMECSDVKERVNTQSTYLYNFLNGFIGDSIRWIDDIRPMGDDMSERIKISKRRNVFLYDGEKKTTKKDERPWSFTRTKDLPF